MTLADVRTFYVPNAVVDKTQRALRNAGKDGYELFVLWSGVASDDTFEVNTPHVPKQTSYRTRKGLFVRVEGAALHELNAWLYQAGETLAAQVHAHPDDAYHSDTDETYPIVTERGGLSIVAPAFARDGVFTSGTAVFRLSDVGWVQIPTPNISRVIHVVR